MDRLVGVEVRVAMRSGRMHEGQIFTIVEEMQVVVLGKRINAFKTEYAVLNTAEVTGVEVLQCDLQPLIADLPAYEPRSELQLLYEEISKTYRCVIDGAVLQIPDLRLRINPPYGSIVDIAGQGGSKEAVSRLGKVLTETRQRLRL